MSIEARFQEDSEFRKLLVRDGDVDLTVTALEVARDAYPNLDFSDTLGWIAARAAEAAGTAAKAHNDVELLGALVACLLGTHGLKGDRESYEQADASYLNRVIETKRGIPISLSLVYLAVAGRLGIALSGVCAPGHFLARYESVHGPLFLDAFSHGKIMTFAECASWIGSLAGLSRADAEASLNPADARTIVIRMLNNLKALHVRQSNWRAAWRVQDRLTALKPGSYRERRDFAITCLKCHLPGQAMKLLDSCLKTCPSEERDRLLEHRTHAQAQIARWN